MWKRLGLNYQNPDLSMLRMLAKLNLLYLLSESRNFRNDGWVQSGYREKYKKALKEYIIRYPSLDPPPRG